MFRNTTLPFSRIIHSLDPSNTGKLNIFQNYCITMQISEAVFRYERSWVSITFR